MADATPADDGFDPFADPADSATSALPLPLPVTVSSPAAPVPAAHTVSSPASPIAAPATPKKRTLVSASGGAKPGSGKADPGKQDRVFAGKADRTGIQAKLLKAYFVDGSFVDPTNQAALEARCAEIARSLHLEVGAVKTQIQRVLESKPKAADWSHQRWYDHNRQLQTTKAATPRMSSKARAKETEKRKQAEKQPGGFGIGTAILIAVATGVVFWLLNKWF